MAKYRKKPVVIEAEQFDPRKNNIAGVVPVWITYNDSVLGEYTPNATPRTPCNIGFGIKTLEGWFKVVANDWIITGVNGERYPCKPDIFEKTYEPVREERG